MKVFKKNFAAKAAFYPYLLSLVVAKLMCVLGNLARIEVKPTTNFQLYSIVSCFKKGMWLKFYYFDFTHCPATITLLPDHPHRIAIADRTDTHLDNS